MANWWTPYILQNASRYGIDPRAALSVARAEGLGGGAGDQGTSFGPFQLHVGGALPSGRGRSWAESKAGIDYALRQMGSAKGLTGRAAINAIVRNFERPADPTGEVARALGTYGQEEPGISDHITGAVMGAQPKSIMVRGPATTRLAPVTRTQRVFDPSTLSQGILAGLASGQLPDIGALAQAAYKNIDTTEQVRVPVRGKMRQVTLPPRGSAPPPRGGIPSSPQGIPTKGGWSTPATGKVIGTPGAGTHTLGNWESDRALDIALPVGTPVYAPFGGVIGSQFGSLGAGDPRFAGLRLHVASPQNEWYGAHLSGFAPGIRPGVRVRPGQLLGYSGSANGVSHLHEALKRGNPYRLIA